MWSHYGSPWLQDSAQGRLGVLAQEASQALSLRMFGQYHHLANVEIEGAQRYGSAVRKLSSRISTVGAPGSEALLITIMILLLHSVSLPLLYTCSASHRANNVKSTGNSPQASMFHIQAIYKLLQICGPKAFAAEPLRGAFESCRATLVRSIGNPRSNSL